MQLAKKGTFWHRGKNAQKQYTLNLNGLSVPGFSCAINGTNNATICAWTRNLATYNRTPAWREQGGWGGTYFGINGSTIEVRFGSGSSNSKRQYSFTHPVNSWVHLAFVRDNGTYRFYKNGTIEGSQTGGTAAMKNNASLFTLVNGLNGDQPDVDESIVMYCFFNRALSQSEITAVYNAEKIDTSAAPFNSGLLLGLNLTEGSGNQIYDSASGNSVTIGGAPSWDVEFIRP